MQRPLLACLVSIGWMLAAGCRSEEERPAEQMATDAAPRPKTPDRVAPGVLLEGEQVAFGFRAPVDMKLVAHFNDAAHFEGRVKLSELEDYVRERTVARHVEVTPTRSVFPNVKIRGGDPERLYRFELTPRTGEMLLVIRDVTPPPSAGNLSEAEAWKRAGLTPDGKLIDPQELE